MTKRVKVKVKLRRKPKVGVPSTRRLTIKRVDPFTRIRMDVDGGVRFVWYETAQGFPKRTKTDIVSGLVFFTFWDATTEAFYVVEASTGFTVGKGGTRSEAVWDCRNGIQATGVPEFRELVKTKQAEHARLIWKDEEEINDNGTRR